MQIETGPGGTIVTNPDRRLFALMSLKGRLNIEINTGLKHSRGSTITAARGWGYTGPNRKQKCLDWTIAELDRREQQLFKFTPPARLAQMVRSRYNGDGTYAMCAVIDHMETNGEVTTPAAEENSENYWDKFWTDGRINR
jgi:hypothetical protein